MRYRKLDDNGDMQFGNQQADFYRDVPEAVAQATITRLRLWLGEWYLDISEGTPYQGGILGMHTKESANPLIRDRILRTQGNDGILSYDFSFNPDERVYSVSAEINTIYGTTTVAGVM